MFARALHTLKTQQQQQLELIAIKRNIARQNGMSKCV